MYSNLLHHDGSIRFPIHLEIFGSGRTGQDCPFCGQLLSRIHDDGGCLRRDRCPGCRHDLF